MYTLTDVIVLEADPLALRSARGKRGERSTEVAFQRIKQRILENEYPPGTQILEQDLALDLGLSRTPVREALIRLEREGLVEVVPRHGMRVLPLFPRDMREIYDVLTSLEPTAAELLAARRPSPEEVAPLAEACAAMEAALAREDRLAWAKADEAFHLMLVELCGNRRLAAMVMMVWEQSHRARMFTLKLRALPVDSTREHKAALDAIQNGDPVRAREIYRAHRERGREVLMSIIEQYGLSNL
jgi:DNA-binding GntR family transcriptional regulator